MAVGHAGAGEDHRDAASGIRIRTDRAPVVTSRRAAEEGRVL